MEERIFLRQKGRGRRGRPRLEGGGNLHLKELEGKKKERCSRKGHDSKEERDS